MSETRKIAAILVADVVGYSRLAGADEDRTLSRLRGLRSDLIDPAIAAHHGRVVKRTGDGIIIEFRSVVDAVRCAIEVQTGMVERNAGLPPERRIEFRVGIHLGDVVEEADGDLMGDGVNIAARLEGIAKPGGICISDDAFRQVKSRLDLKVSDLGSVPLKNIAEPLRVYSLEVGAPLEAGSPPPADQAKQLASKPRWRSAPLAAVAALVLLVAAGGWYMLGDRLMKPAQAAASLLSCATVRRPLRRPEPGLFSPMASQKNLTTDLLAPQRKPLRDRSQYRLHIQRTRMSTLGKSGKELGVRYVLEGSVQRDAGRMRVNVQLIDAESGKHLWADRFDKPLADLFEMQDEIVAPPRQPVGNGADIRRGAAGAASARSRFGGPLFSGHGMVQQGDQPRKHGAGARLF